MGSVQNEKSRAIEIVVFINGPIFEENISEERERAKFIGSAVKRGEARGDKRILFDMTNLVLLEIAISVTLKGHDT